MDSNLRKLNLAKAEFLSNAQMAFGFKRKKEDVLDKQTDDLYNQIGGLKMENEWLIKVEMRSYEVMKALTLNQSCPGIPDHFTEFWQFT